MNLLAKFKQHWQTAFPQFPPAQTRLLVTVSGGVDSVVLLHLVAQAGFEFEIAHVNFQLRGTESQRDEDFVRSLATQYNKPLHIQHFDTAAFAATEKIAIQEAARKLRYQWFNEILATHALPDRHFIMVTAHHADDNIETLLMHFFRGTGLEGLGGIAPYQKKRKLVRPLLPFKKSALLAYAYEHQLSYVEDSSNSSDKYTRNYFRNQVIPLIKEVYPQAEENLLQNIERFREAGEIYRLAVDKEIQQLKVQKGVEWHIPIGKWKKVKALQTITWELIKPFGFQATQTPEIIKLSTALNGAFVASASHRIIKNREWLIISPLAIDSAHQIIESADSQQSFQAGILHFMQIDKPAIPTNLPANEVWLDAALVNFPLILRPWKTGDYFYPLGMQKKKKINRFLIDLKLSRTEKEKVWVLEANKKIGWVVGYRMDDRFRITNKTTKAIKISYLK